MRIELRLPERFVHESSLRDYDESIDDIRSILSDVCGAVGSQGELVISGFGQQRWPVDLSTDLVVLLEQLPSLIRSISSMSPARLDLYEQGIERALVFNPAGDCYDVLCESNTDWRPRPSTERIRQSELLDKLLAVKGGFMRLIRTAYPEVQAHPWVESWLKGERSSGDE